MKKVVNGFGEASDASVNSSTECRDSIELGANSSDSCSNLSSGTLNSDSNNNVNNSSTDKKESDRLDDSAQNLRANLKRRKQVKNKNLSKYKLCIALFICFFLLGCGNDIESYGYVISDDSFDNVKVGMVRDDVLAVLGSPSARTILTGEKYIYYGKQEYFNPLLPNRIKSQNAVIVGFDNAGFVSSVSHIDNFQETLLFDTDSTEIKGNEMGPVEQIISNIGRVNLSDITQ